jgi:hypothetical protein
MDGPRDQIPGDLSLQLTAWNLLQLRWLESVAKAQPCNIVPGLARAEDGVQEV